MLERVLGIISTFALKKGDKMQFPLLGLRVQKVSRLLPLGREIIYQEKYVQKVSSSGTPRRSAKPTGEP